MATIGVNKVVQHLRLTSFRQNDGGLADGDLLEHYIDRRDEAAFEALLRRHGPMVLGVCRRILGRNEADAEDAFQATFLVLVRKANSIRPRGMVGNWLFGVAQNTSLKAKAMIHKRRLKEREAGRLPKSLAAEEVWRQVQGLLDEELGRLPDKYRVSIVLCDLEGKTIKEAARHLGWPQGTLATRLAQGRKMLAKRLSAHGFTLSAGALAALLCHGAASASTPASLISSTIKAASCFAAGSAAASVVSAKVAALTDGVLKAMMISKIKAVVAVVLVLGFIVTGATVLSYRTATAQSATPAPPIAAAQDTKSILEGSQAGDRKELVPGIAFRWCPAGKFKMGEGDDTVDVELSEGFWLGETEVTHGQWKKLMGTSPWSGRTGVGARASTDTTPPKEGSNYAASYISYDDALSFCKKLTTQEQGAGRLPKSWKYSLPTEAQWEYACRAGTKTKFSFGDDESQLSQYAWFWDPALAPDNVAGFAHQVGLKKPNAWGLRDMHGNVWEWCNDWYASKRSGGKDPVGPTTPPPPGGPPLPVGPITPPPPDGSSGRNRVIRGGSSGDVALTCTSANRFYYNPRLGNGFRIAAVPAGQDDKKPMAEKPVEPAAKQEKEKEAFTAWGKEVGGLQAGLAYYPGEKRAYSHGETVKVVVRVRNVGKEEVKFQYLREFFLETPPAVTDGEGKPVHQPRYEAGGQIHIPVEVNLAPGKEIELYELKLELRPASEGLLPRGPYTTKQSGNKRLSALYGTGKFQIQYERVFGMSSSGQFKLDPILGKLATGKLELEIKSDPPPAAPEKKEPPKQDKEGFTAWGKEVDGLQAGAALVKTNPVRIGEKATVVVKLRNVSKAPINVSVWPFWLYPPGVVDAWGRPVRATTPPMPLFDIIPTDLTIKPGQTVVLAKTDIHVAGPEDVSFLAGVVDQFTIHVLPGKYKAQLEGFLQGRPSLSTGAVEFEVKADPPPPAGNRPEVTTGKAPEQPAKDAAKTDLDRLQGVWSVVSIERGGKRSELDKEVFMVDGKRACWQTRDSEIQGGLYLEPTRKPKTYDLAISTKTIEGIYALEGDTLRLCYDLGTESKRPGNFITEKGSQQILVVLKRTHGREVFPFRLPDGTRAFPTIIERAKTPPPLMAPQPKANKLNACETGEKDKKSKDDKDGVAATENDNPPAAATTPRDVESPRPATSQPPSEEPRDRGNVKRPDLTGRVVKVSEDGKSFTVEGVATERPAESITIEVKIGDKTAITYDGVTTNGAKPTEGYAVGVWLDNAEKGLVARVGFGGSEGGNRGYDLIGTVVGVDKDGKGIELEVPAVRGVEKKKERFRFDDKTVLAFSDVAEGKAEIAVNQTAWVLYDNNARVSGNQIAGKVQFFGSALPRFNRGEDIRGKLITMTDKSVTIEQPVGPLGGEPKRMVLKLGEKCSLVYHNVGPGGAKSAEGQYAAVWFEDGSKETAAGVALSGEVRERWVTVRGKVAGVSKDGATITLEQPSAVRGENPKRVEIKLTPQTRIGYSNIGPDGAKPTVGYLAQMLLIDGSKDTASHVTFTKHSVPERGR